MKIILLNSRENFKEVILKTSPKSLILTCYCVNRKTIKPKQLYIYTYLWNYYFYFGCDAGTRACVSVQCTVITIIFSSFTPTDVDQPTPYYSTCCRRIPRTYRTSSLSTREDKKNIFDILDVYTAVQFLAKWLTPNNLSIEKKTAYTITVADNTYASTIFKCQ